MSCKIETYTSSDLLTALVRGKTEQLEQILAQRDPITGTPTIDINRLRPSPSSMEQTAFRVALFSTPFFSVSPETRAQMISSILGVNDLSGKPVLWLNEKDSNGDTVVEQLMGAAEIEKISEYDLAVLTSRIFNMRNPDGSRVFELNAEGLLRIHKIASSNESFTLVARQVEDLRNADGSYAVPRYRLPRSEAHEPLPFDQLGRNLGVLPRRMVDRGNERAALATNQRRHEIYEAHNMPFTQGPLAVQIAANHPQNVHNDSVEQSVERALKNLCTKYFPVQQYTVNNFRAYNPIFNDVFAQIQSYVSSSKHKDRKILEEGLAFIAGVDYYHPATMLSLKQILGIVWTAASDLTAPCPSNPNLIGEPLLKLRRDAILDAILNAETAYGARGRSCAEGYSNMLVNALNQAHNDVQVFHVETDLGVIVDSLKVWMAEKIQTLPLLEQAKIFASWDEIETNSACAARSFLAIHQRELIEKIKNRYYLSNRRETELKQYWYSLPKPDLDDKLGELGTLLINASDPCFANNTTLEFKAYQCMQSRIEKAVNANSSIQWICDKVKEASVEYLAVLSTLSFLDSYSDQLPETKSFAHLHSLIQRDDAAQAMTEAASLVKKELEELLQEKIKTATLHNWLMLCVPVFGWLTFLFRLLTQETPYFTPPQPKSPSIQFLDDDDDPFNLAA